MFSVCVPSWINCCQGLYIQSRLFQVLYIQSPPAFQKFFCLDRFLRRIKPSKNKENRLNRVLYLVNSSKPFSKTSEMYFSSTFLLSKSNGLNCGIVYKIRCTKLVTAWSDHH